jgi:hypothetical protein
MTLTQKDDEAHLEIDTPLTPDYFITKWTGYMYDDTEMTPSTQSTQCAGSDGQYMCVRMEVWPIARDIQLDNAQLGIESRILSWSNIKSITEMEEQQSIIGLNLVDNVSWHQTPLQIHKRPVIMTLIWRRSPGDACAVLNDFTIISRQNIDTRRRLLQRFMATLIVRQLHNTRTSFIMREEAFGKVS